MNGEFYIVVSVYVVLNPTLGKQFQYMNLLEVNKHIESTNEVKIKLT